MDRTSSLKITADSNQSAVPAQKTQIYEASKGHRLQSSVCSFTERSVITVHYKGDKYKTVSDLSVVSTVFRRIAFTYLS